MRTSTKLLNKLVDPSLYSTLIYNTHANQFYKRKGGFPSFSARCLHAIYSVHRLSEAISLTDQPMVGYCLGFI